jgi:hypothetical protein
METATTAAPVARRAVVYQQPRVSPMFLRLFGVVLLAGAAPVVARAADEENPYKNVKVGDYAVYKMTTKVAGFDVAGTMTQSVVEKSDKEAKIKVVANINGMDLPAQEQVIDLTKPYDRTKVGGLPGGGEAKVEKGKEGKEKIKVGNKEYEATWTSYKVKANAMGQDISADVKTWMSKDVPMGMVKMQLTMDVMNMKVEMTMELTESGNKK